MFKFVSPPFGSIQNPQKLMENQFHNPPPPPIFDNRGELISQNRPFAKPRCSMCDTDDGVSMKSLKRDFIPLRAYLALFLGCLIGLIAIMVLKVRHDLSLPFCGSCWKKSRKADRFEALSVGAFFLSIVAGLVLLLNFDSAIAFFSPIALSFAAIVWSQVYKIRNSPKFRKIDRKQVIVSTPAGDLIFAK